MGYATKQVKRRRHNSNLRIIAAATFGGAQVTRWDYVEYYSLLLPSPGVWAHAYPGSNPITLWKYAAKRLGVRF